MNIHFIFLSWELGNILLKSWESWSLISSLTSIALFNHHWILALPRFHSLSFSFQLWQWNACHITSPPSGLAQWFWKGLTPVQLVTLESAPVLRAGENSLLLSHLYALSLGYGLQIEWWLVRKTERNDLVMCPRNSPTNVRAWLEKGFLYFCVGLLPKICHASRF